MGIRKSKITPSINVDDMLKKAEISHEIETDRLDVDKRLKEICEIKETLLNAYSGGYPFSISGDIRSVPS